jgi:hypothetical protein
VGAPGLDDLRPVIGAVAQRGGEVLQRGHDVAGDGLGRGEVDRGREDVIAALRGVDVVVGVHWCVGGAAGEGRDDLVGVHVRAGSRAGLEHVHGELRVVRAGCDLVGGRGDGGGEVLVQHPDPGVHPGRSGLHQPERPDLRAFEAAVGDREVLHGPLHRRAPKRVDGHPDLADGVVLNSVHRVAHLAHAPLHR